MEIEVFITFCMETDNMEKEGSLSMEIEGIPTLLPLNKGYETTIVNCFLACMMQDSATFFPFCDQILSERPPIMKASLARSLRHKH